MSQRKPHSDVAGYVCELRNQVTGIDYVVIYDRTKGFECDAEGRYVVVCEAHGTMIGETSFQRARMSMKSVEFCEQSHASKVRQPVPMKIVSSENETVIYPMLTETEEETEEDYCIVLGNSCTLINNRVISEDDIPRIIAGLEKALDIINK